jgi:tetratricopeptide (TPR) repeat protein
MKRWNPLAKALAGIGLIGASLIGLANVGEPWEEGSRFFDPLLGTAGTSCLPAGNSSQALLRYYRKVAAKTELGPFRTTGDVAAVDYEENRPPLWDNLGGISFPITTRVPLAQRYFDQGLRLTYGFNHAEARRAFRAARELDPSCAMCWWGEALVLGPNINAPMVPAAQEPALAALGKAGTLAAGASDREQALIGALARRYSSDPKAERAALDAAYAQRMGEVAARFPDDQDIQALYAEALMDLSPWDYWQSGGAEPQGRTAEIVDILEGLLAKNPDHPGAIHYYIHMVEASSKPERAKPYLNRLAAASPGVGHLVHMPFHIYYRVGEYKAALDANKAAVAADEAYLAQVPAQGIYPQAYYPHNVHSLMVSAQMAGDGRSALEAARKVADIVTDEAAREIPWVQPIKAAPYFAHAQFAEPAATLALPDPGDGLPYAKAMWHYARGVAHAARGNLAAAEAEGAAIERIKATADFSGLVNGGVPAPDVLELARHVVSARIAQARGNLEAARRAFETAVALEDRLYYSEPPYWYYPVRQSLGAVLVGLGRLEEAEDAFRASLARSPGNGWALYGLGQVYRKMGKGAAAAGVERLFERAWVGDSKALSLARL